MDSWINLPFNEHWKVYIKQENITLSDSHASNLTILKAESGEPNGIERIMKEAAPRQDQTITRTTSGEGSPLSQVKRQMLVIISVSTDDKRSPYWLTLLRLFIRASGITVYVFATSVFAAVSLLALPMAQMLLTVILGVGIFGRAIAHGLVLAAEKEKPVMHLIADDKDTANRMLLEIMQMQHEDPSSSYVFEVNGKLWVQQLCVGLTKRWKRRVFGVFADVPSITVYLSKKRVSGESAITHTQSDKATGFELASQEKHEMGGERVYDIQAAPIGKLENPHYLAARQQGPVTELESSHSAIEIDAGFIHDTSPQSTSLVAEMAGHMATEAELPRTGAPSALPELAVTERQPS
jgi:hypothetical protein